MAQQYYIASHRAQQYNIAYERAQQYSSDSNYKHNRQVVCFVQTETGTQIITVNTLRHQIQVITGQLLCYWSR
jgi:hypothetical protein